MDKVAQAVLLLLWMSSTTSLILAVGAQAQFCSRAVASKACAKPPTIDDIKVEEYLGKWYEIGSTASFKLLTEAGLACDQARYTSTPQGNLTLLNSGLKVINPLAIAGVGTVSLAARGVCGGAREVCYQLSAISQVSESLKNLSTIDIDHGGQSTSLLLRLADDLANYTKATEQTLQGIAGDVSRIQQANAHISQANYSSSASSSLQSRVADINEYVQEASKGQGAVASLASHLNKIRAEVWEMRHRWSEKSKLALEQVSFTLGSIALKVGASSTAIDLGLRAVEAGANGALLKEGQPIQDSRVVFVTGSITQPNPTSAAGKLEVEINGVKAPYWIIALETASSSYSYSGALVYSCSEVAAGVTAKSLFVLSREPQLQEATLHAFLAKAESLGIYNDCDDPFLLTLQRGSDCGQQPN